MSINARSDQRITSRAHPSDTLIHPALPQPPSYTDPYMTDDKLNSDEAPPAYPGYPQPKYYVPRRYIITALILLSNILCYADRTNIGIAVLQFGYSDAVNGDILAAFFYGYLCTQIIGGYCSSVYGGKIVLLAGVTLWVICDGLTIPTALSGSLIALIAARVGMGLGEGVNFPSDHNIAANWFILTERSALVAIYSVGTDMGTILSTWVSPQIIKHYGWTAVYIIYCGLGVVWIALFSAFASSKPEWHKDISAEERTLILNDRSENADPNHDHRVRRAAPWAKLLRSPSIYGIFISHFFFNYGFYVSLSWLPKYFSSDLNVDLASSGYAPPPLTLPYIGGAVGGILGGRLADYLISSGWRIIHVRKLMNTIGGIGGALSFAIVAFYPPSSGYAAAGILTVGFTLFRFSFSGYWANMIDVCQGNAGEVMGISNTLATIPGILGNQLTGAILSATGSWALVFGLACGSYVLGALSFLLLADDKDIARAYDERVAMEAPFNPDHVADTNTVRTAEGRIVGQDVSPTVNDDDEAQPTSVQWSYRRSKEGGGTGVALKTPLL